MNKLNINIHFNNQADAYTRIQIHTTAQGREKMIHSYIDFLATKNIGQNGKFDIQEGFQNSDH